VAGSEIVMMRLSRGLWEGVLHAPDAPPELEAVWQGEVLGAVDATPMPETDGDYKLRMRLPVDVLNLGVQTVLFRDKATQMKCGQISLIAGTALEDDLRAEISLLRAELDLLKSAFRSQMRAEEQG